MEERVGRIENQLSKNDERLDRDDVVEALADYFGLGLETSSSMTDSSM